MERGWRDIAPNCPRCGSSNTKFCYYNNYSLTQPRYFCKGCRRYWTRGGSLRNVPVGGGCRKTRRSRSSSLRLVAATSSNHHHHHSHYDTTPRKQYNIPILAHVGTINHSSCNSDGDLSNMIKSSTLATTSSDDTPHIDLAIVYANFLDQKEGSPDQLRSSIPISHHSTNGSTLLSSEFNNQPNVDFSRIPDATTITPTTKILNTIEHNHHPFSQTLSMGQSSHEILDTLTFDSLAHPHPHSHEHVAIQHAGIGLRLESQLPPLPGESLSNDHQQMHWISSYYSSNNNNNNNNLHSSQDDGQLSNLFAGNNWMSSLDLPSFESSSSLSTP